MKKLYFVGLIVLSVVELSSCASQLANHLTVVLKDKSSGFESHEIVNKNLRIGEIQRVREILFKDYMDSIKSVCQDNWDRKVLVLGDYKMPFDYTVFGEEPKDGRSLYISMHGGGNAPAKINDEQWNNQKKLYRPKEGVYLSPRAHVDDWNMWFRKETDAFFKQLIQMAVINLNVNPNKVYLMGYSAGGDGAYRLAPRMAQYWAAASMMAGHPGEIKPEMFMNIPFSIWMGEKDSAYNRNVLAAGFAKGLDSLAGLENNKYYKHECHIVKDHGHWMYRKDTLAVAWMSKFVRKTHPQKIRWIQGNDIVENYYCLSVDKNDAEKYSEISLEFDGNTIYVAKSDYKKFTIYVDEFMCDLTKNIKVIYDDKIIFDGKLNRTILNLYNSIRKSGDINYAYPSKIDIEIE